jgi:hypothetical protein
VQEELAAEDELHLGDLVLHLLDGGHQNGAHPRCT